MGRMGRGAQMRERKGVSRLPPGRRSRNGGRQGCKTPGEIVASNGPNRFRVLFKSDGRQPFFSRGVDLATLDLPFFSNLPVRRGGRLCVRSFLRRGRALIHRLVTVEQNKYRSEE